MMTTVTPPDLKLWEKKEEQLPWGTFAGTHEEIIMRLNKLMINKTIPRVYYVYDKKSYVLEWYTEKTKRTTKASLLAMKTKLNTQIKSINRKIKRLG